MRLFVLLGALIVAGGAYLGIAAVMQVDKCLTFGNFSIAVWDVHFWLLSPDSPSLGLGPNGQWFLRLAGGAAAMVAGGKLIKFSTK